MIKNTKASLKFNINKITHLSTKKADWKKWVLSRTISVRNRISKLIKRINKTWKSYCGLEKEFRVGRRSVKELKLKSSKTLKLVIMIYKHGLLQKFNQMKLKNIESCEAKYSLISKREKILENTIWRTLQEPNILGVNSYNVKVEIFWSYNTKKRQ